MKLSQLAALLLCATSFYAQEVPKNQKQSDSISKFEEQKLSEVTVYGKKRQFLKVDSDKTTVNVKNNPMLNS